MNKRILLIINIVLITALVLSYAVRYEELDAPSGVNRYYDRWTGYEWYVTREAGSSSREPAKYYGSNIQDDFDTGKVVIELQGMLRKEQSFAIAWWTITIILMLLFIYNLVTIKKQKA